MADTPIVDVTDKLLALEMFEGNRNLPKNVFFKGPPGAGKTEFLIEVAVTVLGQGKRVLVLTPDYLHNRVVRELEKQRRSEDVSKAWMSNVPVSFSYSGVRNRRKRLIISKIPSTLDFREINVEVIMLVHLNRIHSQTLRSACEVNRMVVGSFDEGLPRDAASAIQLLEENQIEDCKILNLVWSNRSDKVFEWSRKFIYPGSGVSGNLRKKFQMTFVDSRFVEHEGIIDKLEQLRDLGVSNADIGVTAVTRKSVDSIDFFLAFSPFSGIKVRDTEFWSTKPVKHFLVAMCSNEEIIIEKEKINEIITRATESLTVFGNLQKMKDRLMIMEEQDHDYWIEFHKLFNKNLVEPQQPQKPQEPQEPPVPQVPQRPVEPEAAEESVQESEEEDDADSEEHQALENLIAKFARLNLHDYEEVLNSLIERFAQLNLLDHLEGEVLVLLPNRHENEVLDVPDRHEDEALDALNLHEDEALVAHLTDTEDEGEDDVA